MYGLSRIGSYRENLVLSNVSNPISNTPSNLRFEITDHLGSVRAVVSGSKEANNKPTIISLSDYSDFGWMMQSRSFTPTESRYGYQGSERDQEYLGGSAYTTEFRMLDVRLGRWFSPDAITQPWQSSYTSMDNNPIAMTDVLGLSTGPTTRSPGGNNPRFDPIGLPPINPPSVTTNFFINGEQFAGQGNKISVGVLLAGVN